MDLIHEGEGKRVYQAPESPDKVIIEFTDVVTVEKGEKIEEIKGRGELVCRTTEYILGYLEGKGIDTHLVKTLEGSQLLCRKVDVYPFNVVCHNVAAGSFCDRYDVEKGKVLDLPVIEFSLNDSLISENGIISLGLATEEMVQFIRSVTLSTNYYLTGLLRQQALEMIDFNLEFGRTKTGHIVISDEFSDDTMRIWESESSSRDKEVFKEDKKGLIKAYTKLVAALNKMKPEEVEERKETVRVIVNPKSGIKNPPGEVTKKALVRLGFGEAEEVSVGKIFNIYLRGPVTSEVLNHLKIMSIKLLSNPISENQEVSFK